MSDLNEHYVKCTKFTCIALAVAFAVLVGGIVVYNIHANVYMSRNLAAKAELVRAQAEVETKRSDAIQYLIDGSINPIAARCAIIGWSGPEETTICALFTKEVNILRD